MPSEGHAPDSVALADGMADRVAAYVHIPFCRRICPYCDFAVTADSSLASDYIDAVCAEIDRAEPFSRYLTAVAIGGGTPTSVPAGDLERILGKLADRFGFDEGVEISVEANPEDLDSDVCRHLAEIGVTRLSIGVQSYDDAVLGELGRLHSADEARRAVQAARDEIAEVNVDLIFGAEAESESSWKTSLSEAIAVGVDHVSTYALTVERGTELSRQVAAGAPAPDPDAQADRWLMAAEMLDDGGFTRYETSNHARPGRAVSYNLITWAQGEYEAFGNGAHRHRDGERSWNVRRVDRYVERIAAGDAAVSGRERLDDWASALERLTLGLRRSAGVRAGRAGMCFVESDEGRSMVEAGVLEVSDGRLRVARPLLGDAVSRAVLALEPADC